MSTLKVDQLEAATASTITVPSGQTLDISDATLLTGSALGGAWIYLARQTLTADASDIQFRDGIAATNGTPDFGNDYAQIMFVLEHFTPATDGGQGRVRISTDTGSNYLDSGYFAVTSYVQGDGTNVDETHLKGVDSYRLTTSIHNDGALGVNGNVNLFNTSDTTRKPFSTWSLSTSSDGDNAVFYSGGAHHNSTNQNVDAVRIYFHIGNVLAASTIRMYGLKAS